MEPFAEQWLAQQRTLEVPTPGNPWALRDMAKRLLEAHNRGCFGRDQRSYQLEHLRQLVLSSESPG